MRASIRKWGNSPSVRIPASVMAAVGLRVDQAVDVRAENGRVIVEPIIEGFDFKAAVEAITPDNRHDATDFGAPQGAEAW
jgi:antitoxin MazE